MEDMAALAPESQLDMWHDKLVEKARKYYAAHREQLYEQMRIYYAANRDKARKRYWILEITVVFVQRRRIV